MAQWGEVMERHQAEAARLRAQIESLVKQARVLLHGDVAPPVAAPPRPANVKRAEREKEMEHSLERADWYRREIRRLRHELGSREQAGIGPGNVQDRDPMGMVNLLAERRKELQRLKRAGEGLERVAEAQKRAEAAQKALRPEVAERLLHVKAEVDQHKRRNVKLQADRLKYGNARKVAEEEVRAAGDRLRDQAAQLQKPSRQPGAEEEQESRALRQLRQNVDILKAAAKQDEKRFKAAQREEDQEAELAAGQVTVLNESIMQKEAEVARLQAVIRAQRLTPRYRPLGGIEVPPTPSEPNLRGEVASAVTAPDDGTAPPSQCTPGSPQPLSPADSAATVAASLPQAAASLAAAAEGGEDAASPDYGSASRSSPRPLSPAAGALLAATAGSEHEAEPLNGGTPREESREKDAEVGKGDGEEPTPREGGEEEEEEGTAAPDVGMAERTPREEEESEEGVEERVAEAAPPETKPEEAQEADVACVPFSPVTPTNGAAAAGASSGADALQEDQARVENDQQKQEATSCARGSSKVARAANEKSEEKEATPGA